MSESRTHHERKYKSSTLHDLFQRSCEAAIHSDFQKAKEVSITFQHLCDQIAISATHDLGYPPTFEGELNRVGAWMNSTISAKTINHSQREQYEYFLSKAFDWAWKTTEGEQS